MKCLGGGRKECRKQLLLTTPAGLHDGSQTELESDQEERRHRSDPSPALPTQLHAPDLVNVPTPGFLERRGGRISGAPAPKTEHW